MWQGSAYLSCANDLNLDMHDGWTSPSISNAASTTACPCRSFLSLKSENDVMLDWRNKSTVSHNLLPCGRLHSRSPLERKKQGYYSSCGCPRSSASGLINRGSNKPRYPLRTYVRNQFVPFCTHLPSSGDRNTNERPHLARTLSFPCAWATRCRLETRPDLQHECRQERPSTARPWASGRCESRKQPLSQTPTYRS